jgi:hypothetical protein
MQGYYYMNIPTGTLPPSYPVASLSESEYLDKTYEHTPITTSFSTLNTSYVIPRPDPQYFRIPSLPNHISTLAKDNLPILFIHITHFANVTCIGFSIHHGIFDGAGMGMIVNAINDEFSGREWTVPSPAALPGHETTILEEAFSAVSSLPPSKDETLVESNIDAWKREIPLISMRSATRFRLYLAYEMLVQKHKINVLYLSERAVKAIVDPIQAQIKARGDGSWVSTGDILVAWFVKVRDLHSC